jgi:hypothetical protein
VEVERAQSFKNKFEEATAARKDFASKLEASSNTFLTIALLVTIIVFQKVPRENL